MLCQVLARWLAATVIAAANNDNSYARLTDVITRVWDDSAFPISGLQIASMPQGEAYRCAKVVKEEAGILGRPELGEMAERLYTSLYQHTLVVAALGQLDSAQAPHFLGFDLGDK